MDEKKDVYDVKQVLATSFDKPMQKQALVYVLDLVDSKEVFIAQKLDFDGPSFVKATGIFSKKITKSTSYMEMIQSQPKEDIKEVMFPWPRVNFITNITFRAK